MLPNRPFPPSPSLRPARALLALACAAALPAAAQAQSAPPLRLPSVVVSATYTERDTFEVPASIDAEPARRLDRLNVNVSETLNAVPGVLARNRQNYAQDEQISIRGFGARSTFGIRGVRLYTDGIPASMPDGAGQVSHFNLETADRIEVLRGPFSALYGNSSGGVVQIFTADGTATPELRAGIAGGSDGTLRANLNARGVAGDLDYNLGVTHFETDGHRAHSAAQRTSGNGRLRWQLPGGGNLSLVLNTVNIPNALDPLGLGRAQFEQDPRSVAEVATTYNTRKSVSQQQGGLIWEQPLAAAHSLRAMGYYGQRDVFQVLAIPPGAQASPLSQGGVIDLANEYGGGDVRWLWNGQLAGAPLEVAAGVAVDRQRQHRTGYENFVGDALGVVGRLRRDQIDRVESRDLYAQASWTPHPDWTLSAGARRSRIDFDSRDRYITATNPDDSGTADYGQTTPVAGVLWRASPTVHAYAAYGRGFETPTFAELGYRNDGGSGLNLGLAPARTRNAELGVKLRPDAALGMEFAVFRADSRDELAVATNSGGRTTYQNIDRSRRQGAEAALRVDVAPAWQFRTAFTWVDATFESPFLTCTGSPCTTPDTPVAAGQRIPGVAREALFMGLRWQPAETGWQAGLEGRYIGEVPTDDLGRDRADAYAVFALSAGYTLDLPRWRIGTFARVDNLFDRHHAGSVIVNDGNGRYFEPGPGRTFLVGADLRWRAR
ncbi:TonB-dependent receptor family protein [Coralloluteibacterium thermophilus]|uniref:TonB-dependent receptor family protein n=1 Tax=Coralloluteibacterium thermophilum TaxID=2707049 RepID=A0ABV9NHD8_9GAMM